MNAADPHLQKPLSVLHLFLVCYTTVHCRLPDVCLDFFSCVHCSFLFLCTRAKPQIHMTSKSQNILQMFVPRVKKEFSKKVFEYTFNFSCNKIEKEKCQSRLLWEDMNRFLKERENTLGQCDSINVNLMLFITILVFSFFSWQS